ncbi:putative Fatty acyl-CoA synthetase A [Blattamonas nauphoetae]|uniref:Fatty acyl-CoA synthetase A n=1 Tax=Blattamonas nauphoetae TaxID=2049346 RepID=A0ABQ9YKJ8_9EUKA|nr:putative Fatty acyl-CoA synthetase A [Blattamonas nauphoetae]
MSETAVEAAPSSTPSCTEPQSCPFRPDKSTPHTYTHRPDYESLYDYVTEVIKRQPDAPCCGTRKQSDATTFGDYEWTSYQEFYNRCQNFGSFLIELGAKKNDRIGIMSLTNEEFLEIDFGCQCYNLCSVPIYSTFGAAAVPYLLNHSNCRFVFVHVSMLPQILKASPRCPNLKAVIVLGYKSDDLGKEFAERDYTPFTRIEEDDVDYFNETYDPLNPATFQNGLGAPLDRTEEFNRISHMELSRTEEDKRGLKEYPFRFFTWSDVMKYGSEHRHETIRPKRDDVLSIMYTSGTTGTPKGVIMHHDNLLSTVVAGALGGLDVFKPQDTYLAYLPLAHVFERVAEFSLLTLGSRIGYGSGDTKKLVEEINILKPSLFVGVPRVLNTIYDAFVKGVAEMNGCVRALFNRGLEAKKVALKKNQDTPFYNTLIFNTTKKKTGGNIIFILCGSAPLNPKIHEFLQCTLCAPIQCGYSMTETSCSGAVPKYPDTNTYGHCGSVMASLEMKLVSVEEMGYLASENKGEIWMRGPAVFHGYYRDPWQSREIFTEDGWVKSGDIGMFDENHNVYVIDRKKNIFKLSQGEYVAPEQAEAVYLKGNFVEQSVVYGESEWRYTVAVVAPRKAKVLEWAKSAQSDLYKQMEEKNKAEEGSGWAWLIQQDAVKKAILEDMRECGKKDGLNSFQIAAGIITIPEPFGEDYVTPSLKVKRFLINKDMKEQFKACYESLNL